MCKIINVGGLNIFFEQFITVTQYFPKRFVSKSIVVCSQEMITLALTAPEKIAYVNQYKNISFTYH